MLNNKNPPLSRRLFLQLYYTYILECSDKTLYTGYTNNLAKRVQTHNKGLGAKYTKTRLPVKLVYYEEYDSKSLALKREYQIKKLKRKDKLALILDGDKKCHTIS